MRVRRQAIVQPAMIGGKDSVHLNVMLKIVTTSTPADISVVPARSHVVPLDVVVLATDLSGRHLASALASAGLSVAPPGPTLLLLAGGWGLALVAIAYAWWSFVVLFRRPATAHIMGH